MKRDLWLLYGSKYDTTDNPVTWSMARHCLNHDISFDVLFIEYFSIENDALLYNGTPCTELPFLVFFRGHELALAMWFEKHNVRVINNSYAIEACDDKLQTYRLLGKEPSINLPLTFVLENHHTYDDICCRLGPTFILKHRFGMKGESVFLISSQKEFNAFMNSTADKDMYIEQQFIASSRGKDLRVYVAGDTIIGAVYRFNDYDFRANVSLGGNFANAPMDDNLRNLTMKIAGILRAEIVAIDYLIGDDELFFCEANSTAGFHAFNRLGYATTSIIMNYVCNQIKTGLHHPI